MWLALATCWACSKPPATPAATPAVTPASAASPAAREPVKAPTASAAAGLPAAATPEQIGPVTRRALAGAPDSGAWAVVAVGDGGTVLHVTSAGQWEAQRYDAAGREVWHSEAAQGSAAPPGSALIATRARDVVHAGLRGQQLALQYNASGKATLRKLPQPLVGLMGQSDGSVMTVLSAPTGARAARLTPEGGSMWEEALVLPGPVTAAVATLRDDAIAVCPPAAGPHGRWTIARLSQADGSLLWSRQLDGKIMPPQAELLGISGAPRGAVLVVAGVDVAKGPEFWTILGIDANGNVAAKTPVARAAPTAAVLGDESGVLFGQARDAGLHVEMLDPAGNIKSLWRAGWLGLEVPLSLARSPDGTMWALSQVATSGKEVGLLLTRLHLTPALLRKGACPSGPCQASWQVGDDCASASAADGAPCGAGAVCTAGVCGAPPSARTAPPADR